MYKKITHQITEEHFDHPMALHAKAMMDSGVTPPPPPPMLAEPESVTKFKNLARSPLSKFFWRVRSYIVSVSDSADDQAALEAQLLKDITAWGDLLIPYYGAPAAMQFDQLLKSTVLSIVDIVKAAKAGRDIKDLRTKTLTHVDDLAKFLEAANPTHWPRAAVNDMLTKLVDAWIDQAVARGKKAWTEDFAALDNAQNIFMSGNGIDSFFTVFIQGIAKQFADKFKT